MNKNSFRSSYERESDRETDNGRVSRKLGGLANRLAAGMHAAADSLSTIGKNANRRGERESPVKDCGYYDREKYSIMGYEGQRQTEDASYVNEREGVFGIFDGAGGVGERGSGRIASQTAKQSFANFVNQRNIRSADDMAEALVRASRDIAGKTEGITTATVAKVVKEKNGEKYLHYAQAGDSRLYVISGNTITQVTRDEGVRNMISNWLGREDEPVQYDKKGRPVVNAREQVTQTGKIRIHDGDMVVMCSDGITGDVPGELMDMGELGSIVKNAGHVQIAARQLVERARKKDDRSAIVFEV